METVEFVSVAKHSSRDRNHRVRNVFLVFNNIPHIISVTLASSRLTLQVIHESEMCFSIVMRYLSAHTNYDVVRIY